MVDGCCCCCCCCCCGGGGGGWFRPWYKEEIEKIKKIRRSRKYVLKKAKTVKLGLNFEKISLVAGNML